MEPPRVTHLSSEGDGWGGGGKEGRIFVVHLTRRTAQPHVERNHHSRGANALMGSGSQGSCSGSVSLTGEQKGLSVAYTHYFNRHAVGGNGA